MGHRWRTWNSVVTDPKVWSCLLLFSCALGIMYIDKGERAKTQRKRKWEEKEREARLKQQRLTFGPSSILIMLPLVHAQGLPWQCSFAPPVPIAFSCTMPTSPPPRGVNSSLWSCMMDILVFWLAMANVLLVSKVRETKVYRLSKRHVTGV